jgi:uncharacterized protein
MSPEHEALRHHGRRGADQPERLAVAFVRLLREAGLAVPGGAPARYAEALAAVGLRREGPVYWAGRATLVSRPEDVPAYDAAFRAFWHGSVAIGLGAARAPDVIAIATDEEGAEDGDDGADRDDEDERQPAAVLQLRYSPAEVLRHKDFAECSPDELAEAQRLMAEVRWRGERRRTRRRRRARHTGDWPDMGRTVRHALRTGGEPLHRHWYEQGDKERRVVFLCDVSGSMAPYSRPLLRFLHVAVAGRPGVEVFTVGTRLTRITRVLSARDPDAALAAAAGSVPDWSGGTRLGDALRQFNDRWGTGGLARGAVVVILSDGWDRGDPSLVAAEMARLSRVAHQVVWVNPLKATPGYAPLVRGMAAALPYVDRFLEGHSLGSLESLVRVLTAADPPGRRRGGRGRIEVGPSGTSAGRVRG